MYAAILFPNILAVSRSPMDGASSAKDELIQKVKELEAKLQSEVLKDAQKYEESALSQIPLDLKHAMGLDIEALDLSKNKVTELKRKK